jgi:hypothetical protein
MSRKELYIILADDGTFWGGIELGWVDNIIFAMSYTPEEKKVIEQLPYIGELVTL